MLKRTCDRCGATIDNEWYKMEINCKNNNIVIPLADVCVGIVHTPDYCEACIRDIEQYASKKITRDAK